MARKTVRSRRKRAQKGDGCIRYDTARGVWTDILDIGRDPETGKRRRRKVSHADRDECQALMDGLKAEKRQTGTVARRDVTVRHVVDEWLEHGVKRARSPITKTGHSDSAARICEGHGMLGGKRLVQLETTDVELAMARMAANGYSASSIKQSLSVLRRAIDRAIRDKKITVNVADRAERPDASRKVSKALAEDEITKLRAVVAQNVLWSAYLDTSVMHGFRPGEMLGLTWDDIDFENNVIHIRHALKRLPDEHGIRRFVLDELKTPTSKRSHRMAREVRKGLLALKKRQARWRLKYGPDYGWDQAPSGLVFCTHKGTPLFSRSITRQLRLYSDKAEISRDWTAKTTRHTWVSHLSHHGVPVQKIAEGADHANSRVTATVYTHVLSPEINELPTIWDGLVGQHQDEAQ